LKKDLCLVGSAEEIYIRASRLSADMIRHIIDSEPVPQPQEGEPTIFKRRKPHQSEIPDLSSLLALYDFVRMLDAEGYPKAFLEHGAFRYEFCRAAFYDGRILAEVKITPIAEENT
jgi:methionyl-tRNA formyltransferase